MWNRLVTFMTLAAAVGLSLAPLDIDARGGGRGGGGPKSGSRGGGGAYRGGKAIDRTPTMSRAANRPASTPRRQQGDARQSVQQARAQQPRQALQQRPSAANRTELRNQVSQYAQSRPAQSADRQSMAQRAQNFSGARTGQIAQNRQLSNRVTNRLQQAHPNANHWFDRNFFDHHNIDAAYVRTGGNWWRPAAWATLATWGAWRWSQPYYYDYGGYVYPLDDAYVYSDSTGSSTTATDSSQSQPAGNTQTTASGDWLPLGVFAVASSADTAAQSNRFVQLALNRSGEIAGVLYNSATDVAQDLVGTVDPSNQKAYWSLDNRIDAPIASTGVYNLTEDQTPINVHFPDGSDQTWTLVRIQPVS